MNIYLIESSGRVTLIFLFLIGLCGVLYHLYLSSRLSFVDFGASDTSNKKEFSRIMVPWVFVTILCAIVLIYIVESNNELKESLEYYGEFVKFPWNYIMPTITMEMSILTCIFVGTTFYFIIGIVFWLVWKIMYGRT